MIAKFEILGRVGVKPELRHTTNGTEAIYLSVATNKTWNKDGQKHEKTSWHRVKVFGNMAAVCAKYLDKGSLVYIDGEIQENNYEKNGETVYSMDFLARNIKFISTGSNNQNQQQKQYQQPKNNNVTNGPHAMGANQNFYVDNIEFGQDEIPF
jgi:single-strand DNA-binding protein